MADNTLDISMDQGSSLNYLFTLKNTHGDPIDITGYDVRMQIRKSYGSSNVSINCTLANNKVSISDAANGVVGLHLQPTDTALIRFNAPEDDTLECVYDLEMSTPGGVTFKVAKGTFTINREVTR